MKSPLQLYSFATPNGQKIGIALEEMELAYDAHIVDITKNAQFEPKFVEISPNSKIPALVDHDGPDGKPLAIFESGAILLHLAHKTGKFWSDNPREQSQILQWLFFQVGGVGPIFGQFGHFFKFAADKCKDPYPLKRYTDESRRFLKVIEARLTDHEYLAADKYTIADMATVTWIHALKFFYQAEKQMGLEEFENSFKYVDRLLARPHTAKGLTVCKP
jgi:GST-like protein